MIESPIRFDRLQAALRTAIIAATGAEVVWAYGQKIYDAATNGDLIDLRPITGLRRIGAEGPHGVAMFPPTHIDLVIGAVVAGQRFYAEINDHAFLYDALALDDAADVRDGLIEALAGEALFSAAASGADVRVTPTALGGVWQMALAGALAGTPTLSTSAVRVYSGAKRQVIAVECFSKKTTMRGGAWALASAAQAAFEAGDLVEALEAAGVAVQSIGAGVDLSGVAGPAWESRVSFDLEIDLACTFVRPIDHVEIINLDIEGVGAFSIAA